ncbi:hypothetical protein CXK86_20280 [Paenibacillus sp. BGI2013]|uniref:hypothetical protein n=1 Tax=Paenibacillus sp. BGI2013 TaxID=2058902 RepID=UPI000C6E53B8|nr:hypothetical protein [Paenibacillus sp. BGI2013]PKQ89388.1 hypothetical protein CXK86_20280 [Paenibacillus sp. BGI2013]
MEKVIECGVIIKGEFHRISIHPLPTDIIEQDYPWVGHERRSTKVSFSNYEEGQLISFTKEWKIGEINKIGVLPNECITSSIKGDHQLTTEQS